MKRLFMLAAVCASLALGQSQNNLTAWGFNIGQATGGATPNMNGGYIRLSPITYNPFDSGTTCYDYGGNIVNQPLPTQGASSFGANDILMWVSTSPSMPFTNGTGLVQNVIYTSPATTGAGPCGVPLAVNGLYGINTNGYFFARGGHATDLPVYNSIQSLQGGMTANQFLAGTLYPTGAITQCCGTLSSPAYLGGHIDIGHSSGPPASAQLTSGVTGGSTTTLAVNSAQGLAVGTQITFEDASPETVTVAGAYTSGSLSVPVTVAPVSNHSSGAPIGWNSGTIAAVTNPFSGGEGLVQGQFYFDDGLGCPRMWYGIGAGGWKCTDAGGGGSPSGPSTSIQFNNSGSFLGVSQLLWNNSTGVLSACIATGGICTVNSGVNALAFSSTNTGGNAGYTNNGTATSGSCYGGTGNCFAAIYGNGQIAGQWLAIANEAGAPTPQSGDAFIYADATHLWLSLNGGSYVDLTAGTVASPSTSVQFNNSGAFGGNANFEWNNTSGNLSICTTLGGICTTTSGVNAQAFSSSATSSQVAFTDATGNFEILANGEGAFQSLNVGTASQFTVSSAGAVNTSSTIAGQTMSAGSGGFVTGFIYGITAVGAITGTTISAGSGAFTINSSGFITAAAGADIGTGGLQVSGSGGTVILSATGFVTVSSGGGYIVGTNAGITSTTCSQFTKGICTAP